MPAKVDLDAMLEDHVQDEMERGSGVAYFKVQSGQNRIRLLPPHEDAAGRIIIKGGVHWINNRSLSCPIAFKASDECFFCDLADELFGSDDERDKKQASKLSARIRFYANVINASNPDAGIRVWEFGRTVYDQILRYLEDEDYGDVSDVEDGYDLKVLREGSGLKTKYDVRAVKHSSALDADVLKLIEDGEEDGLFDLHELRPFLDPSQMKALFEGDDDDDDDEDEDEDEKPRRRARDDDDDEDEDEDEEDEKEEDEEEEEEEEEEEDEPPRKKSRSRPGRPIAEEEESSRGRGRSTRAVVDEVLRGRSSKGRTEPKEEKPAKKSAKKSAKKPAKKSAKKSDRRG